MATTETTTATATTTVTTGRRTADRRPKVQLAGHVDRAGRTGHGPARVDRHRHRSSSKPVMVGAEAIVAAIVAAMAVSKGEARAVQVINLTGR